MFKFVSKCIRKNYFVNVSPGNEIVCSQTIEFLQSILQYPVNYNMTYAEFCKYLKNNKNLLKKAMSSEKYDHSIICDKFKIFFHILNK